MKTETRVLARHKDDNGNIIKIFHITHFSEIDVPFHTYWTRSYDEGGNPVHRTRRMVINKHSEFSHVTERLYRDTNQDGLPLGNGTYTVMLRQ